MGRVVIMVVVVVVHGDWGGGRLCLITELMLPFPIIGEDPQTGRGMGTYLWARKNG